MERRDIIEKFLDKFFENCKPARFKDLEEEDFEKMKRLTSREIQEATSDMITMNIDEIADYMIAKGYDMERWTDTYAWLIMDEHHLLDNVL